MAKIRVRTCLLLLAAALALAALNFGFSATAGAKQDDGDRPMCRVARIVHQCWKSTMVDGKFKDNVRSWVLRNPGWEYRFWTDDEMRTLVASKYPEHLAMYDGFPHAIMRADAFRAFVLHAHGGVYADLDFEALRPLSPLLGAAHDAGHGVLLGQEPLAHAHVLYDLPRMVCNAIMASCPGHPFWRVAMAEMRERRVVQHVKTVRATGPKMLTAAADTWQARPKAEVLAEGVGVRFGDVRVASPGAFYPLFDDGHVGATNMRAKCREELDPGRQGAHSARRVQACATLDSLGFHNRPMQDFVVDADPLSSASAARREAQQEAVLALGDGRQGASEGWGKGMRSRPFAVHHWAHTWLGGYYGGAQFDVRKFAASLSAAADRCSREAQSLCPSLVPGDRRTAACVKRAAGGKLPNSCERILYKP